MIAALMLAASLTTPTAREPALSDEAERARSIAELMPCDAAKAQSLVGRAADTRAVAEAIQRSGASHARIVRPGDPTAWII